MTWKNSPHKLSRFSRILLTGWLVCGLMFLISTFTTFNPSPALARDPLVEAVVGASLACGSALAIISAFDWKDVSRSWSFELLGWPLLAGAWGLYATFVILHGPWEFLFVIGLSSSFGSVYRFMEVLFMARQTRRNVAHYRSRMRDA